MHARTHTHTRTHTCTHMHTHVHTCTHMYAHAEGQVPAGGDRAHASTPGSWGEAWAASSSEPPEGALPALCPHPDLDSRLAGWAPGPGAGRGPRCRAAWLWPLTLPASPGRHDGARRGLGPQSTARGQLTWPLRGPSPVCRYWTLPKVSPPRAVSWGPRGASGLPPSQQSSPSHFPSLSAHCTSGPKGIKVWGFSHK